MTTGTSNFVNFTKACDYYRSQGNEELTPAQLEKLVKNKIEEGEIELGQPTLKDGQTLRVIDNGCRYAIQG
jgi:hypothetical protein